MRKITLVVLQLFVSICVWGQVADTPQEIEEQYSNDFAKAESSIYLHLNKTAFFSEETLWLAAYITNTFNHSGKGVNDLYIDLFSEEGDQVLSETILVSNGFGHGSMNLEEALPPPGEYILRARTKLGEENNANNIYYERIEILGPKETNKQIANREPDLQMLPEGGHILAGIQNRIGVKLIAPNGKGLKFSNAQLLNSQGEVITSFSSNRFGIGSFTYMPKEGITYKVEISTEDGEIIEKTLQAPEKKGYLLSAHQLEDDFIFTVKTNEASLKDLKQEDLILAYRDLKNLKLLSFETKKKSKETHISIKNDSLFPGVNVVTLLDSEMNPISERMVYNSKGVKRGRVDFKLTDKMVDSIRFSIKGGKSLKNQYFEAVSISILPGDTKAYNPSHSIFSATYLEPFLQGHIEDPRYYFSDKIPERRRGYDLDLLLLTQGWSKYSWDEIFKNSKPVSKVTHGFAIRGKINDMNPRRFEKLMLESMNSGVLEVVELEEDGSFDIDSLFIRKDDTFSIGLLRGNKQKVKKPEAVASVYPVRNPRKIPKESIEPYLSKEDYKKESAIEWTPSELEFGTGWNQLDTIMLSGKGKEKTELQSWMRSNVHSNVYRVTDEMRRDYTRVISFIRYNGFTVLEKAGQVEIYSRPTSLNTVSPIPPVEVIIDGMKLRDETAVLNHLKMNEVDYIILNKSSIGTIDPTQGRGGVIKIQLRKDFSTANAVRRESTMKFTSNSGYSALREFYIPKYKSFQSDAYNYFGIIDWKPSIILDSSEAFNWRVKNTYVDEVKVFIEGMGSNNRLISEEFTIPVDKVNQASAD